MVFLCSKNSLFSADFTLLVSKSYFSAPGCFRVLRLGPVSTLCSQQVFAREADNVLLFVLSMCWELGGEFWCTIVALGSCCATSPIACMARKRPFPLCTNLTLLTDTFALQFLNEFGKTQGKGICSKARVESIGLKMV